LPIRASVSAAPSTPVTVTFHVPYRTAAGSISANIVDTPAVVDGVLVPTTLPAASVTLTCQSNGLMPTRARLG
jgi:hypothetical protein